MTARGLLIFTSMLLGVWGSSACLSPPAPLEASNHPPEISDISPSGLRLKVSRDARNCFSVNISFKALDRDGDELKMRLIANNGQSYSNIFSVSEDVNDAPRRTTAVAVTQVFKNQSSGGDGTDFQTLTLAVTDGEWLESEARGTRAGPIDFARLETHGTESATAPAVVERTWVVQLVDQMECPQ